MGVWGDPHHHHDALPRTEEHLLKMPMALNALSALRQKKEVGGARTRWGVLFGWILPMYVYVGVHFFFGGGGGGLFLVPLGQRSKPRCANSTRLSNSCARALF
jgi:hypothetical protein